jgi:hypothetical protein
MTQAVGLLLTKRIVAGDVPLSTKPGERNRRYRVADPYLRFWLTFVDPNLPLIERGRPDLVLDKWRASWQSWRGRAIEPVVREALLRMLPDDTWPAVRKVGGWWPRANRPEVDLVGADREPANAVIFAGSIKWHENAPFTRADLVRLAADAQAVPGVTPATPLVAVSRRGLDTTGLAVAWEASDLLAAWSPG